MTLPLSIVFGCLLSAACGLRVFIPFLCINLFSAGNLISLPSSLSWLASSETLHFLVAASIIEIIASYFPVFSIFYKTITIPLALTSGIAIMSFFLLDANINVSPIARWGLATIFGGTLATLFRSGSIMIDGGVPHPLKAIEEILAAGASVASIVALIV